MRHKSVPLGPPCEILDIVPLNPLISKCQIKVCYVSDEPNRNKSVITRETAKQLANSLPGNPIVGFYNEDKEDFEEHNRSIDISNGKWTFKDTTRPYGFVGENAKVWFQWFLDDDKVEREYLCTEGYLWTGQYPECARILTKGNNQSMELDEDTLDATWSKDDNGKPEFFIINEGIISKLCILGEECEPCFEGSSITKPEVTFSFEPGFMEQMRSMMDELKELLKNEGGAQVFTRYAVEIGDYLWSALYSYIEKTYPGEEKWCSKYSIDGVFEENGQKFAVLVDRTSMKYFRLDFSIDETNGLMPANELVEVTKTYVPASEPQFALADVEAFETEYKKQEKKKEEEKEDEDKKDQSDDSDSENKTDGEDEDKKEKDAPDDDKKDADDKKKDEDDEEFKKKKKCYSIEEYEELNSKFSQLQADFEALSNTKTELEQQIATLTEFKLSVERKEKQSMIERFYMLSDEDKADVIANIDTYSLDDIEAKLSVICVRNKVNFNLDDDRDEHDPMVYSLNNHETDDTPAWVLAVLDTAKTLN